MNVNTSFRARAALALTAAALTLVVSQGARAVPSDRAGIVAGIIGSPDPRDTASGPLAAELLGPVRPDGPALRAAFDELAARAARSRGHELAVRRSPVGSTAAGFSWRDAWIGGGATFLLGTLVGLGLVAASHRGKKPARA